MQRYSIFSLARHALSRHERWPLAWRSPAPKKRYEVVIIGGGGHGLATAYYLAKEHGIRDVAVLEAGGAFGIMPYGTEAMSTLRIEKGHVVVGSEIDGRTTAADLGLDRLISPSKWCIGKPLLARAGLTAPERWQLTGLTSVDGVPVPRGAKIVADPDRAPPNPMLGHVTSCCFSPNLDAWIALAIVAGGRSRHGEVLWAVSPLAGARARVRIGPPCFIDPEGKRPRA